VPPGDLDAEALETIGIDLSSPGKVEATFGAGLDQPPGRGRAEAPPPAISRLRPAPRRSLSCPCGRRFGCTTSTSPTVTFCLVSSARVRVSRYGSWSMQESTSSRCGVTSRRRCGEVRRSRPDVWRHALVGAGDHGHPGMKRGPVGNGPGFKCILGRAGPARSRPVPPVRTVPEVTANDGSVPRQAITRALRRGAAR
jgi:hypothetical protein